MGTELAPDAEWDASGQLDMGLARHPLRAGFARFLTRLGELYRARACLWHSDVSPDGFAWIDCADREQSVLAYLRRFFDDEVAVVLNLTPVPRPAYRIGVPRAGTWTPLLCSDAAEFGGSGHFRTEPLRAEPTPAHRHPVSIVLALPPLSALVLAAPG
jgi:1,4-alpha-glucan branching enzyme